MALNIEIKARIPSVESLLQPAAAIATEDPVEILQDDTFFRCAAGRLKLRAFSDDDGELIFYRRNDEAGPKQSFYLRSPTTTPAVLREALALAYGVVGRVRKHRTLFMAGSTRIHLDRVEGLGDFLELEVVMSDQDGAAEVAAAQAEAIRLMGRLGIEPAQLIDVAYVDLATAGAKSRP
jgi:predicted adenylyl cyclase CyaB